MEINGFVSFLRVVMAGQVICVGVYDGWESSAVRLNLWCEGLFGDIYLGEEFRCMGSLVNCRDLLTLDFIR